MSRYKDGGSIEQPRYAPDFSKICRFICGVAGSTSDVVTFGTVGAASMRAARHTSLSSRAPDGKWHVAWRIAHGRNLVADLPDIVSVGWEDRQRGDPPGKRVCLVFKHPDGYEIKRM